jgi:transglutaminase-like putative cysteine protease
LGRAIRFLLLFTLFAAFAAFVWPTRWRFDHMTVDGDLVPVRIDRFNGNADVLVPDGGWVPVEGTPDAPPAEPTRRSS